MTAVKNNPFFVHKRPHYIFTDYSIYKDLTHVDHFKHEEDSKIRCWFGSIWHTDWCFFYLYLFLTLFDAFGMLKCSSITLSLQKDNCKSVYVHAVSICDCDEIPGQ